MQSKRSAQTQDRMWNQYGLLREGRSQHRRCCSSRSWKHLPINAPWFVGEDSSLLLLTHILKLGLQKENTAHVELFSCNRTAPGPELFMLSSPGHRDEAAGSICPSPWIPVPQCCSVYLNSVPVWELSQPFLAFYQGLFHHGLLLRELLLAVGCFNYILLVSR